MSRYSTLKIFGLLYSPKYSWKQIPFDPLQTAVRRGSRMPGFHQVPENWMTTFRLFTNSGEGSGARDEDGEGFRLDN